jgi:hypothetical protein
MSVNDLSNTSRTDWAALEAMMDEKVDYSDKEKNRLVLF